MYQIILAAGVTEGNAYARAKGFKAGTFRVAARAATIRGLRVATVHILPSYADRRDKAAIEAVLRYSKGLERLEVTDWVWDKAPAVDQGDGMGEQLSLLDALAGAVDSAREARRTGAIANAPRIMTTTSKAPVIEFSEGDESEEAALESATAERRPDRAIDTRGKDLDLSNLVDYSNSPVDFKDPALPTEETREQALQDFKESELVAAPKPRPKRGSGPNGPKRQAVPVASVWNPLEDSK